LYIEVLHGYSAPYSATSIMRCIQYKSYIIIMMERGNIQVKHKKQLNEKNSTMKLTYTLV
jgi:hypothetical protein